MVKTILLRSTIPMGLVCSQAKISGYEHFLKWFRFIRNQTYMFFFCLLVYFNGNTLKIKMLAALQVFFLS